MKLIFLTAFLLSAVYAEPEKYLQGGQEAPPFQIPYVVSIQLSFPPNFYHICSGVILTPVWVLTAGSCLNPATRTDILSGKHDLLIYEEGQQRRGIRIASSSTSADGKLALIHLATRFNYDARTRNIGMSFLLEATAGETASFVAWPFRHPTDTQMQHQTLRKTTFKIMTDEECAASASREIDPQNEFCTAESDGQLTGNTAACIGSEGSPLYTLKVNRNVVLGILVEAPSPCNATGQPTGIFARISAYKRWISRVTEQPEE